MLKQIYFELMHWMLVKKVRWSLMFSCMGSVSKTNGWLLKKLKNKIYENDIIACEHKIRGIRHRCCEVLCPTTYCEVAHDIYHCGLYGSKNLP